MSSLLLAALLATRVLSLQDAINTADKNAPALRESIAQADAAKAGADISRGALLPQLNASAGVSWATVNRLSDVQRDPFINYDLLNNLAPTTADAQPAPGATLSVSATLSQIIFDAGAFTRWRQSVTSAAAATANEDFERIALHEQVRVAYFTASANKATIKVDQDALDNKQKHLNLIQGLVNVGSKPEIDLATAKADVASAKFALVSAQAQYGTSLQLLNQTMGVATGVPDFDVSDETVPAVEGENDSVDGLMTAALHDRPDLAAAQKVLDEDKLAVQGAWTGFLPTLSADAKVSSAADQNAPGGISNGVPNLRVDVLASWTLFDGLATPAQVRQANADVRFAEAQRDALEQTIRNAVQNARLSIDTAKAEEDSAAEAVTSANEQLRLAEARYAAGAGSIIEVDDAQSAAVTAGKSKVQADQDLSTARAALLLALAKL